MGSWSERKPFCVNTESVGTSRSFTLKEKVSLFFARNAGLLHFCRILPIPYTEQKLRSMGHDDDIVLNYLAKYPGVYVSPMEVCKRADSRRRFNESPDWAKPVLV